MKLRRFFLLTGTLTVMVIMLGSSAMSLAAGTSAETSPYDDWASQPKGSSGTKSGGTDGDLVSGSNYGENQAAADYGSRWSMQDGADFLVREGLSYDNGFNDEFSYAECAQGDMENQLHCYAESKYVRPYFVDLTYHPDQNAIEFEFIRYASES